MATATWSRECSRARSARCTRAAKPVAKADIEAGAGRPAAELLADFRAAAQALDDAWNRVPDNAWGGTGVTLFAGAVPISTTVSSRCRELLVHLVDLDLGATPADLPAEYVELDLEWLREQRGIRTWPDAPWA